MASKTYYYARVSSAYQNLDRQIEKFKETGADDRDIITEKKSGKNIDDREAYKAMRNQLLRQGDTLVISSIDRLGRNKNDIKNELEFYKNNDIRVKILDIPTSMIEFPENQKWIADMVNNILIEVLGSMAEQERENIKKRQAEGIAAARKKGNVKFGRPKVDKPNNWNEIIEKLNTNEITAVKAIELTGLSKATFYRLLKES